jgi:hypothetical protein
MRRATSLLFCISFVLTSSLALADEFVGKFRLPDGGEVKVSKSSTGIGYNLKKTYFVNKKRKTARGRAFVQNGQLIGKIHIKQKKASIRSRLGLITGKEVKNDINFVESFNLTVEQANNTRIDEKPTAKAQAPTARNQVKTKKAVASKTPEKASPKVKAKSKATAKVQSDSNPNPKKKPSPSPKPLVIFVAAAMAARLLDDERKRAKKSGKKIRFGQFKNGLNAIRKGLSFFGKFQKSPAAPKKGNVFGRLGALLQKAGNTKELEVLNKSIKDFADKVDVPRLKSHALRIAESVDKFTANVDKIRNTAKELAKKQEKLARDFKKAIKGKDAKEVKRIRKQFVKDVNAAEKDFIKQEKKLDKDIKRLQFLKDIEILGIDFEVVKNITKNHGLAGDNHNRIVDLADPTANLVSGNTLGLIKDYALLSTYAALDQGSFGYLTATDANITDYNKGKIDDKTFNRRAAKGAAGTVLKVAALSFVSSFKPLAGTSKFFLAGEATLKATFMTASNIAIDYGTGKGRDQNLSKDDIKRRFIELPVNAAMIATGGTSNNIGLNYVNLLARLNIVEKAGELVIPKEKVRAGEQKGGQSEVTENKSQSQ